MWSNARVEICGSVIIFSLRTTTAPSGPCQESCSPVRWQRSFRSSQSERTPNPAVLISNFPFCFNTHTHTHTRTHAHTHAYTHTRTHTRIHTRTHTRIHTQAYTHTHTHARTHVGFCGLWGLSIGVMVFILYKLYVLLPYTYTTPKLSPHRRLCASLDFQKNTI